MKILKSLKNRSCEVIHEFFLLPKIIYFNFRLLPFSQAIKLPLYINYGVKIKNVYRGVIDIRCNKLEKYMISFGRGGSEGVAKTSSGIISFQKSTKVIFKGTAYFHEGVRLFLNGNAVAEFGDKFSANKNFTLFYDDKISFGNECMLGWNIEIIDGNGHEVITNGIKQEKNCKIDIGNHVWIGANTKICRTVNVEDNCIVAYGSTITGGKFSSNTLLGGYPAKIIRENINWEK